MTEMLEWIKSFNHPFLFLVLIILNFPLYKVFSELFFGNGEGFKEAIWYWLTPDIVSLFRGDWWNDQWAELKLGLFIGSCVITVAAEYTGISKFIAWALA